MAATTQTALEAAIAKIDYAFARGPITAPKAHAAHLAHKAQVEEIGRSQAEAIKSAPGYSHAMGCFLSPKAEIAFITGRLEADRAPALKIAAE